METDMFHVSKITLRWRAYRLHEGGLSVGYQNKHISIQAELVYPAIKIRRDIYPGAV